MGCSDHDRREINIFSKSRASCRCCNRKTRSSIWELLWMWPWMTWDRSMVAMNFQAASDPMPREGKLRFPKIISLGEFPQENPPTKPESRSSVREVAAQQRGWYNSNSPHWTLLVPNWTNRNFHSTIWWAGLLDAPKYLWSCTLRSLLVPHLTLSFESFWKGI